MALKTGNAGSLIGVSGNQGIVRVEFLQATYVASLERDMEVGDRAEISGEDFKFLSGYGYVKVIEEADEVIAEPSNKRK